MEELRANEGIKYRGVEICSSEQPSLVFYYLKPI